MQRHGVHVRPNCASIYNGHVGRNIAHAETIHEALRMTEKREDGRQLIFVHSGRHQMSESIVIKDAIHIIGAGMPS